MVKTISTNHPRIKYGQQCKDESLETLVTGKAEETIAGLGYTAEMYNVAWNDLVRNFGKPQMVMNAQLKRIYPFSPMKPYDGAALIKFARIVSSCVNVLTQLNYVGDLKSDGVLDSATRKLTSFQGHKNEVAHSCEANEPISTWTRCVQ